jgi:Lrp/AsnC family leucine-responsive transcriptional regulator
MKIKDIPRLEEQVISMLPITQIEMRKALGLSSQDGSELIGHMLKEKLINRTIIEIEGGRTFLLERKNGNGHSKKTDYSVLLSGDKFSPCSGCKKECVPAYCEQLTEWVVADSK